jgi:hypothetical protein
VSVTIHEAHEVLKSTRSNIGSRSRLIMVDSGAGGTVVSDASLFAIINPPVDMACIQFGTGPKTPAQGVGTIQLHVQCRDTRRVHTVYVRGAYYVPTQPLNILSVHHVRLQGGAALLDDVIEPSFVRWQTDKGSVFQNVMWKNHLPYIHSCTTAVPLHTIPKV